MTDEEFLNEMFPYYEDMTDLEVLQTASRRVGAEKMAKWKEEQLIEKACKWLNDWFTDDTCKCGIPITKTAREDFFNDFKKAMMEE